MNLEVLLNSLPRSIKINKIEYKLVISTNRSMNQLVTIYVSQPMKCCNGVRSINMSKTNNNINSEY